MVQFIGACGEVPGQSALLGRLLDPRAHGLGGDLTHRQRNRHVVVHGQVREEREALEDHRHAALVRWQPGDVDAVQQHPAAVDRLQPRQHPQQRRLPAAGRARDDHQLAVAHVEGHPVDRRLPHAAIQPSGVGEPYLGHDLFGSCISLLI